MDNGFHRPSSLTRSLTHHPEPVVHIMETRTDGKQGGEIKDVGIQFYNRRHIDLGENGNHRNKLQPGGDFANNGWLALNFLTVDDEPIATQYCFEYKQKMYFALSGFDPNYSHYGVGNLILMKIIEKCVERKIEEYDLLTLALFVSGRLVPDNR